MKITGYTVTRDCVVGDYCFQETIRSLSAICDEVLVGDAMSADGTREIISQLSSELGNVRIVDCKRDEPRDDRGFLTRWMNFTREHATGEFQVYLDADEVFDAEDAPKIRSLLSTGKPYWCPRLNFWGDHRHIVPSGVVCGDAVVRIGPVSYWMPSDEQCYPEAQIRLDALQGGPPIFHYGFIRHANGFLRKSSWFQMALVGSFDDRLKRAMQTGEDWRVLAPCPLPPIPYTENHPQIAYRWLTERGYAV